MRREGSAWITEDDSSENLSRAASDLGGKRLRKAVAGGVRPAQTKREATKEPMSQEIVPGGHEMVSIDNFALFLLE
jgi:hypothetical protein